MYLHFEKFSHYPEPNRKLAMQKPSSALCPLPSALRGLLLRDLSLSVQLLFAIFYQNPGFCVILPDGQELITFLVRQGQIPFQLRIIETM